MRLAISNIAWSPNESEGIYEMLADLGVRGLEIAPALLFPDAADPMMPDSAVIDNAGRKLAKYGLTLISMQSLLHGATAAQLFGPEHERYQFQYALKKAVSLAGILGIGNLVMGSPRNRSFPDGMDRTSAELIAHDMFRRIGDHCVRSGTRLALEANAVEYGTNFLNTLAQTVQFVRDVNHPGIQVNFDMGNLIMNGEAARTAEIFAEAFPVISHVHISAPGLVPPRPGQTLAELAKFACERDYQHWFSIEMRSSGADNMLEVRNSLTHCRQWLDTAAAQVGAKI